MNINGELVIFPTETVYGIGANALDAEAVGKIGLTIRGMYGEGSRSAASFYQISNQITLGISEKNASIFR